MSLKTTTRTIVNIEVEDGGHYRLGDGSAIPDGMEDRNLTVNGIEFRRDGLLSLNKGMVDESSYIIDYVSQEDKNFRFIKIVPSKYVRRIDVVEITEEKKEDVEKDLQPRH